jgi:hypothetical protein
MINDVPPIITLMPSRSRAFPGLLGRKPQNGRRIPFTFHLTFSFLSFSHFISLPSLLLLRRWHSPGEKTVVLL